MDMFDSPASYTGSSELDVNVLLLALSPLAVPKDL